MLPPLLIASVGNPAPYLNTLHSAGHTLLLALASYLNAPSLQPGSHKAGLSTLFHPSTSSSSSPILLFQSTSFMNTSGPGIAAAWRSFTAQLPPSPSPRLIVLHDDLEQVLGRYSIKSGAGRSARGHNGLKSLLGMPGMAGLEFVRVGVGIGPRPATRSSDDVARFVLKRMGAAEVERVQGLASGVWSGIVREVGKANEMG